ncbi:cytochrome P450 [Streptomyces sp. NPDC021212]|uniref:cytochrome P450 n=1 Tax=Streptomyces sp. NPDC021212 TaxID=3365118 RepID=UPI0037BD7DE9
MIDEPDETGGAAGAEAAEPLCTPEFAKDPSAVYRRLRETYGPLAPVELDPGVTATLCVGYDTALEILRRPETFSKDPRRWRAKNEGRVPDTSHAGQLIRYRPQPTAVDGEEHQRYRNAIDDSTSRIDLGALRGYVERIADSLIDQFCDAGEADLIGEYCALLPLLVLGELFGCPREVADRLFTGLANLFDGTDVAEADRTITAALQELVALKRARPAADVTSWLIAHPERLADHELVEQLMLLTASGSDPVINLIGNALRLLMTDDRFAGRLSGGSMLAEDALDEVLWTDPPLANLAVHFPRHDVTLAGVRLREGKPVVISFAAANQDALRTSDRNRGNRGHLAFSAGPHMCPGRGSARLIASVAIEKLLDRLPDMELAGPEEALRWRPGIYQRGLVSLPVRFLPPPHDPADPAEAGARPGPLPPEASAPGGISAPAAGGASGAGAAPPSSPGVERAAGTAPVPSWAVGADEGDPAADGDGAHRPRPSMLGFLMRWRRRR